MINISKMEQLANKIANGIMAVGTIRNVKATRIQFMSGKWPDNEKSLGGLCEKALAQIIHGVLEQTK